MSFTDGLLGFVDPPTAPIGQPVYDPSEYQPGGALYGSPTIVADGQGGYGILGPGNTSYSGSSSGGSSGGTSTTPAAPTVDPNALAAYNQGIGNIQNVIDRLSGQQSVGLGNIDTTYNSALNQLLQGKARSQNAYDTSSSQALQDYNLAKTQAQQGYNTTASQALQDYNLGKTQASNLYNTTKQQTGQDYVGAKNTIGSNAGTSLNSLLRLLGSRGAGGGSAYNQVAPDAVARQATIQRNDVGQTFGRNQQALDTSYNTGIQGMDTTYGRNKNALDTSYNNGISGLDTTYGRNTNALNTNWQNYLSDVNQAQNDLGIQRTNQTNSLDASINNNRATLLQQLASLSSLRDQAAGQTGAQATANSQSYYDQANQLSSQADALGRNVAVNLQAPNAYQAPVLAGQTLYTPPALQAQTPYTAPALNSYTVNPNAAPTVNGQPGSAGSNYFSPYLASLLGKRQTNVAA